MRSRVLKTVAILGLLLLLPLSAYLYQYWRLSGWRDSLMFPSTRPPLSFELSRTALLPAPVARYLEHVLTIGQPLINHATWELSGLVRTEYDSQKLFDFTATETVTPHMPALLWDGDADVMSGVFMNLRETYRNGLGEHHNRLWAILPVASDTDHPSLNSSQLHRLLSDSPWYPTILLPGSGVTWEAIDDETAMATLTDHGIKISLEFRFNEHNEIASVYSPERWTKIGDDYKQMGWEAHYSIYEKHDGMLVPRETNAGWKKADKQWLDMWSATASDFKYEF